MPGFVAAFLLLSTAAAQEYALVNTTHGTLRGEVLRAWFSDSPYYSFKGVPYAQPPVGNLRFQSPQALSPWAGILDALIEGPNCPSYPYLPYKQYKDSILVESTRNIENEDCLYLNIYTPELPDEGANEKPVMFYIHGGGFVLGNGDSFNLGPDFLVPEGVVLVTINYRLGVTGYLNLQDDTVSGNAGMKDMIAALHWVKNNIRFFGGNPNKITIFGHSAGAAAVHYLMISPMADGLFHQAIAQSGSILNPWSYSESPRERAFRLGDVLGFSTNDSVKLVQFLRNVNIKKLQENMVSALSDEDKERLFMFVFVPSIETSGTDIFLPDSPSNMIKNGMMKDIPFITGVTSNECMFMLRDTGVIDNSTRQQYIFDNFERIVGPDLRLPSSQQQGAASKIKEFYFGNSTLTEETFPEYVELQSDLFFVEGVWNNVHWTINYTNTPYVYNFAFGSSEIFPGVEGVTHGGELKYIFRRQSESQNPDPNSQEGIIRKQMTRMWTNFAKFGSPTPDEDPLLINWLPASSHLIIAEQLNSSNDFFSDRMKFWQSILPV